MAVSEDGGLLSFTATTVFCYSIKDCLKLKMGHNNYPGILRTVQKKMPLDGAT